MANTYSLLQSYTTDSTPISSFSFTSIPSNYTDLCVQLSVRANSGANNRETLLMTVNSVSSYTGSYYTITGASGGASLVVTSVTTGALGVASGSSSSANSFSNCMFYIYNYSNSGNYKSISAQGVTPSTAAGTGNAYNMFGSYRSNDNAAVSSLTFTLTNNFATYSSAYLYGIKNN
jgi:hypothetical protein